MVSTHIFNGIELSEMMKQYPGITATQIRAMDVNYFTQKTETEITAELANKFHVRRIELNGEKKDFSEVSEHDYTEQSIFNQIINLKGKTFTFSVPFTGSRELFNFRLDYFGQDVMSGYIKDDKVCYDIHLTVNETVSDHGVKYAKSWFEKLERNVKSANAMVDDMNNNHFKPTITKAVSDMITKALSIELDNYKLKDALKAF